MSKTPPNRRGIIFEVGAAIEARDSLKNWYAANIEKIDYEDEKVLIHYRQWSHRYDEWFDWTSPYLRPVERIQLRREGLHEGCSVPGFRVNDKVLASWSDCRFYPAKVLAVNKDGSYTVKFYDGVVQTVKGMHVKPFVRERIRQKPKSSERNGEKPQSHSSEKHLRPLESSSSKTRKAQQCTFQQKSDSDSEEDDADSEEGEAGEWSQRRTDTRSVQKNKKTHEGDSISLKEENGAEERESVAEHIGQHNYSKGFMKTCLSREQEEKSMEYNPYSDLGEEIDNKAMKKETEHLEEREEDRSPLQLKPSQKRPVEGKKRGSGRQGGASFKKIKTESYSDEIVHNESKLSTELSDQRPEIQENTLTNTAPTPSSNNTAVLKTEDQSEAAKNPPTTPPAKPVRKQGFHNPNRFSREPLYRVIKNQPPPVLSINLDHNPYKCSAPGCTKSFRKAKLLHYHMKYYHGDDRPIDEDQSPTTGLQSRSTDKQTDWESPKQRCSILHSATPSPSQSFKAEGRSTAQLVEKRRASAPPAVTMQEPQLRPSLKEKGRENQVDRNSRRAMERSPTDAGCMNKRDRPKERKSRSFLRIKLKKKKKKKKSKSGSEENIDISVFGLPSKLNLPLKSPLSRKHPAEAFHSRPGRSQAEQTEVDDEDSLSDWSSDSYGWSDNETGADLDIISSPLSCGSVAPPAFGQEIVRCICEAEDEHDFMIQCEECLCWQHGTCMGLLEEHVPDRYVCFICRDPPGQTYGQRQSLQYWYDHDWLRSGHMYGLSFLKENYSHQNARKIVATHQLLGDVQHVVEVLNGLQLKMSILQSQPHPDLKLWCQPWRQTKTARVKAVHGISSETAHSSTCSEVLHRMEIHTEQLPQTPSSFSSSSYQNSYISSEHCYQKPRAYYPALERRLVVETWSDSELEDSLLGTERVLQYEQHCSGELQSNQDRASQEMPLDSEMSVVMNGSGEELKGSTQEQQWQINLLEHIESVQEEITHRMDFIEKELDVLESWLDYTGELEPPEPLERLPELKHNIKHLMGELWKVQQIALACAT